MSVREACWLTRRSTRCGCTVGSRRSPSSSSHRSGIGTRACAEHPRRTWFDGRYTASAKLICAGCLVRAECLDWALSQPENPIGTWGGTTEAERRPLRRKKPLAA
jgi:hypothetical protein